MKEKDDTTTTRTCGGDVVVVIVCSLSAAVAETSLKLVSDVVHLLSSSLQYHLSVLFFSLQPLLTLQSHRPDKLHSDDFSLSITTTVWVRHSSQWRNQQGGMCRGEAGELPPHWI